VTLPHDTAGSGPAVLLLHNGLCDRRMWDRQMETFTAAHRVVRCDLPGFGDAPSPTGSFAAAEDVVALLDELGIERTALVGNSLGGRVAVDVAIAAPDRVSALVLVGAGRTGWSWSETAQRSWREQEVAAEAGDLDLAVELSLQLWLDGPSRRPGSVGGEVRASVAAMCRRALELELAAGEATERRPDGTPADVRTPTLVLVGELDLRDIVEIGAAYVAEISGARHVIMPGVAHIPSLERPEEFDRLVLEFLDGR
jgi:3-oxoadipate enol-lactonase